MFEVLPEELGEVSAFTECLECHRGICIQCGSKWHEGMLSKYYNHHGIYIVIHCLWWHLGGCNNKRWARVTLPKDQKEAAIRRKNSMELRQVAKSKGWSRCPRCRHMVERIVSVSHKKHPRFHLSPHPLTRIR